MLDLELAAALFRSIDWQHIRRLILVGDAGQLPPIGRGRVFSDVIKWTASDHPESLGRLRRNLRQLLNKVLGEGTAIVALSELFLIDDDDKTKDGINSSTRPNQEELIERIHAGGTVDRDLDVIYWNEPQTLAAILIQAVEARMTGNAGDADKQPYQVWRDALNDNPTAFQILTPHRGELHGVEALNEACQTRIAKFVIDRVGAVDGVPCSTKSFKPAIARNQIQFGPMTRPSARKSR